MSSMFVMIIWVTDRPATSQVRYGTKGILDLATARGHDARPGPPGPGRSRCPAGRVHLRVPERVRKRHGDVRPRRVRVAGVPVHRPRREGAARVEGGRPRRAGHLRRRAVGDGPALLDVGGVRPRRRLRRMSHGSGAGRLRLRGGDGRARPEHGLHVPGLRHRRCRRVRRERARHTSGPPRSGRTRAGRAEDDATTSVQDESERRRGPRLLARAEPGRERRGSHVLASRADARASEHLLDRRAARAHAHRQRVVGGRARPSRGTSPRTTAGPWPQAPISARSRSGSRSSPGRSSSSGSSPNPTSPTAASSLTS